MAEADRHHREELLDTWQRGVEEIHQSARDRNEAFKRATEAGSELLEKYGLRLSALFDAPTAAALDMLRNADDSAAVEIDWAITPPPILKAVGD